MLVSVVGLLVSGGLMRFAFFILYLLDYDEPVELDRYPAQHPLLVHLTE